MEFWQIKRTGVVTWGMEKLGGSAVQLPGLGVVFFFFIFYFRYTHCIEHKVMHPHGSVNA